MTDSRDDATEATETEEATSPSESGADRGGFLVSERDTEEGLLVAVCDEEVLGDTFENGSVSLTVNEEFYGGDPADAERVIASLRAARIANVVGERTVAVAVEAGVVDAEAVLEVGATRHAQLVRL